MGYTKEFIYQRLFYSRFSIKMVCCTFFVSTSGRSQMEGGGIQSDPTELNSTTETSQREKQFFNFFLVS